MDTQPNRKSWQALFAGSLTVLSYTACVFGFLAVRGEYQWTDWSEALYQSLRIFGFEYDGPKPPEQVPALLHVGRLGALMSVMFVGWMAAAAFLRERLTPLRLWYRSPEVLFCGLTDEALRLAVAQEAAFPGTRKALVVDKVSAVLARRFSSEVSRLVLAGNPASPKKLKEAAIGSDTQVVYAAGDTDAETFRIVNAVFEQLRDRPATAPVLRIAALLKDRALQHTAQSTYGPGVQQVDLAWLDPVGIAARRFLERMPPDAIAPAAARIHVLLWGSTPLIEALLLQLARNVYPRAGLTRVTVIAAAGFRQKILDRYPALAPAFHDVHLFPGLHPFVEVEWLDRQPATLSVTDLAALENAATMTCAYVDGGTDDATLVMSRRLLQIRTRNALGFAVGAYFDAGRADAGLTVISADRDVYRYQTGERYLGQRLDVLAMLHNFAYQPSNSIPEFNAPALEHDAAWHRAWVQWRQTPEWKRQSSRYVADHIAIKLRSIGLTRYLELPQLGIDDARELRQRVQAALPELGALEHRRYCAERMLDGWLPVPESLWTPPAPEGLDSHRESLKALRLNATLAVEVDNLETQKDERLAAAIAWMLWRAAQPPAGEQLFSQLEVERSSS